MGIIRFAIENPVKVAVTVFLLTLFGTISIFVIPIQLTPNVDRPIITVSTFWEGASPQEIEREIVERQEEKLKSVSNLKEMKSTSRESNAEVTLEFHIGVDKDVALRDVSDQLRQVSNYPDDVDEPTIKAADSQIDSPIAWLIFFAAEGEDPATLKDFIEDDVKPILERAEGVAEVNVYGGREREVQIQVDAAKMAARGISFSDLETALYDQNKNISAGTVTSGKRDYTWRTVGQFEKIDQIRNTVVTYHEGTPVYVGDIANVENTYKEPVSFVRSVGHPVIAMPVRRESGSNVIQVMKNLRAQIKKVNEEILEPQNRELRLTQVYDETIYINSAIDLVLNNLMFGGILAVIVLLLFLRSASATGIVALCIPISVIGSFLVVTVLGRTLNVIMLAGMAFAVGMVVDNSIVVLENIYRHLQMGKKRWQAALDGSVEVWGAVLASTLTTLAVFLPVVFIQEEAGQLFRDIAIAISAAVGLSLVVAMAVIPTVSAKFLRARTHHINQDKRYSLPALLLGRLVHRINGSFVSRIAVCTVMIGASIWGSYMLLTEPDYLPAGNRNLIFGFLITPPGYSIDEFQRMGTVIEETISPYWNNAIADRSTADSRTESDKLINKLDSWWQESVVSGFEEGVDTARLALDDAIASKADEKALKAAQDGVAKAGEDLHSHATPPPPIENFFYVSFDGGCFMGATSREHDIVRPLTNLLTHAGSRVPGTIPIFFQTSLFNDFGGNSNSIELQIRGQELSKVTAAASALSMQIMPRFGFPHPNPNNYNLGRPEIQITPDRVRAAEVGLSVRDVGQIVQACVDGDFIPGGFRDRGDEIDIAVLVEGLKGASPERIQQTPIYTPLGGVVTLGSIVNLVKTTAPQQINHIEEMPAVTLTVSPPEDMPLEQAVTILNDEIIAPLRKSGQISNDVFTVSAGNAKKLTQTRTAMFGKWTGFNLESLASLAISRGGLALLITFLLMAALFESFIYPLVIMFSVIPATVGGFAGLRIVHWRSVADPVTPVQNLDVLTMLGFVILVGIVVNNAILLVHQSLNNMRFHHMVPRDAITESVRSRFRPIFMTTLTSVCGMLPLVYTPGAGSELYRGLGSVVLGGLLVSTLFTLILVPSLFSLFVSVRQGLLGSASSMSQQQQWSDSQPTPAETPA